MICGDAGRYANAANIASQSMRFLIEPDEAGKIIAEMEQRVRGTW
jgi:serine/threonine-protein kinase HipA